MIFVTGYGQMCNNILQFGHFYAHAKKHNVQVIGMRFCYKYRYFKINNKSGYNWLTYLFAKYLAKLKFIKSVEFNDSYTQDQVNLLVSEKMILVKGWYFRDYTGFIRYREEIKALFDFKDYIKKTVDKFFSSLPEDTIKIGIHIRRGDYKNWHNGIYYYSDEEYSNVINSLISKLNNKVELIIVSNDPKLDIKKIKKLTNTPVSNLNGNPAEDLYLLSKCDYIIGPPSTFSLTAAFYEDKPLYWIFDKTKKASLGDFNTFENLFQHII